MDINVKVIPRAARSEVAGYQPDGALKVRIAAPPEKGKANEALCELLSAHFGVPRRNVVILRGETSPRKRIRILR